MTQHYELMFMIPGSVEETAVPAINERILHFIGEFGGTITSQYDMGRRRLAYPIKQQTFGHYYVAQFDIEGEKIQELDHKLQLDHEVLRHILVKAKPMTEAELKDMLESDKKQNQAAADAIVDTADVAGALPVKETVAAPVAAVPTPALTPVVAPAAQKPTPKLSIEDLDKQLDAILEDTDLESKL